MFVQCILMSKSSVEMDVSERMLLQFKLPSASSHLEQMSKKRKKCQSPRRDAGRIASTSKPKALEETVKEAASHFTSQFPYFLIEIKPYCVYTHSYLSVPSAFVKKLPPQTRMMMLRNANGGKWEVKYRHTIGFPCRLSAGWKRFASANHIKVGDICVFELVQVNELQVHIFRC